MRAFQASHAKRSAGPQRGKPAMLTLGEIELIRRAYDETETVTVEAELGAFLVLLHLCGIEHHSEFPLVKTKHLLGPGLGRRSPQIGVDARRRDHPLQRTGAAISAKRGSVSRT
jgi:hypothetical protein